MHLRVHLQRHHAPTLPSVVAIIVLIDVRIARVQQILGPVAPRKRFVADPEVRIRRGSVHVKVFCSQEVAEAQNNEDRSGGRNLFPQLDLLCAAACQRDVRNANSCLHCARGHIAEGKICVWGRGADGALTDVP